MARWGKRGRKKERGEKEKYKAEMRGIGWSDNGVSG